MVASVTGQGSFKFAVIGAGPSGLAVVGRLLDLSIGPILWIDDRFDGGRLAKYTAVPSNTKAKLFLRFAEKFDNFRALLNGLPSYGALKKLQQNEGCQLEYATNLVRDLTKGLCERKEVTAILDRVAELNKSESSWNVLLEDGQLFNCEQVVLAIGSHPKHLSLGNEVDLDLVLQPVDQVSQLFKENDSVAVIGSSHSAMLAIKTIAELPLPPRTIVNLYRNPLKYAEYLPDDRIKHDNTGLKGEVSEWVRANVNDKDEYLLDGRLRRVRIDSIEEQMGLLTACDKVIAAIGYERNATPKISIQPSNYDEQGRLLDSHGRIIQGLYGVGIAFPERVADVDGSPELAVGLWKFINYIDRIVLGWSQAVEPN